MTESGNQIRGVEFDFGGNDLGRKLDNVALSRFANPDDVWRAPLIFEEVPTDWDCLCALFELVDQPVGEGLVEEILLDFLDRRRDRLG